MCLRGFDSIHLATTLTVRLCTEKQKIDKGRDDTDINVETQNVGKPRQSTNGRIHYERQLQRWSTEVTPSCTSSSPHAAVTMEAATSLSLFLSVSLHALYNYFTKVQQRHILCPKSYLYIYDFQVIYISVLPNRSDGSEPGHRNRVFGLPVLPNFHPEGPVSQQKRMRSRNIREMRENNKNLLMY